MRRVAFALIGFCAVASAGAAEPGDLVAEARAILGPGQGVYVEAADGQVHVFGGAEDFFNIASHF